MKVLLDSHAFLWYISDDPKLGITARQVIDEAENEVFLSIVSLWEIGIKVSLGKMDLIQPFDDLFPQQLFLNGIELLGIKIEHISRVTTLPHHHRDPFDLLLVSQSLIEQMPILSSDTIMDQYEVHRIW